MKYYGLKRKQKSEDLIYMIAHGRAKLLTFLPSKRKKFRKEKYNFIFGEYKFRQDNNNAIPEGGILDLYTLVLSDLIRREDIKQLQKGIRYLLKKRRTNRFLGMPIEGLDEICKRIEALDSTLLFWYEEVDCGIFELKNRPLEKCVDYFSIKISNVNSGYLSVIMEVFLTKEKKEELERIINNNYRDNRGYAFATLTGKRDKTGAYKSYTVNHYNDDALKADKIYEFVSYIEWELMEELGKVIPFVLHKRGVMPPRIEIYATNIDYHEKHRSFWDSIGVQEYQGQFIDERQKMFFETSLSGRYERVQTNNRLVYIFKDDDEDIGQFKSVKDQVYSHSRYYSREYFKFIFLDLLSREAGKTIVFYKHKLDKIKLRKNHLKDLLKLKYNLSLKMDDYSRFKRDEIWDRAKNELSDLYSENEEMAKKAHHAFYISYSNFCDGIISESKKIDGDIDIVLREFEEKKQILQNLSDYNNAVNSIRVNIVMLIIATLTLFFVIFPGRAVELSHILEKIYEFLKTIFLRR